MEATDFSTPEYSYQSSPLYSAFDSDQSRCWRKRSEPHFAHWDSWALASSHSSLGGAMLIAWLIALSAMSESKEPG
jgi:hypothetical protein